MQGGGGGASLLADRLGGHLLDTVLPTSSIQLCNTRNTAQDCNPQHYCIQSSWKGGGCMQQSLSHGGKASTSTTTAHHKWAAWCTHTTQSLEGANIWKYLVRVVVEDCVRRTWRTRVVAKRIAARAQHGNRGVALVVAHNSITVEQLGFVHQGA